MVVRSVDHITRTFRWLEQRLDEGQWFRRGYVIAATILTWRVVEWAFVFAEKYYPSSDVALVIGAVVAAPSAVTGFAFSGYLSSRR